MNKFQVCLVLLSLAAAVSAENKESTKTEKRSHYEGDALLGGAYGAGSYDKLYGSYGSGASLASIPLASSHSLGSSGYGLASGLGLSPGYAFSSYGAGYAAPAAIQSHGYVPTAVRVNTVNEKVAVPKPYPVPYTVARPVPYAVPQPYPVAVPRPVGVPVPQPVPYPVDKPYPVVRERPVPHPVPVPAPYKVIQKVAVPVPHPVPVDATPLHDPVPVHYAAAPASVAGLGTYGGSVLEGASFAAPALSSFSHHDDYSVVAAPHLAASYASYAPSYTAHHSSAGCL